MEKERKITAPEGYEVEKIEPIEGAIIVTYKEKERKLPKSWGEFCYMFPIKEGECFISEGYITTIRGIEKRREDMKEILPDRATAEAVLSLCQLIQLRDCYNGDWVPDWEDGNNKFVIIFCTGKIETWSTQYGSFVLCFKTKKLRDEFLRNFRDLIEKLKPLYGIKKGGEE